MAVLNDSHLYENMKCVIVTGGTSGLGLALAESLHAEGKKVIISGRRKERLDEIVKKNSGMIGYTLDVKKKEDCEEFVKKVIHEHPEVDTLVNNAGIQKRIDFEKAPIDEAVWNEEILVNIHSVIRLSNLFIPHFKTKPHAAIINVSSGLGLFPMALMPIYCATKAFLHSFSNSFRHQLRNTNIRVVEIIPPAVESELNPEFRNDPLIKENLKKRLMPIKEYNDKVLEELKKGELLFGIGMSGTQLNSIKEQETKIFNTMNAH